MQRIAETTRRVAPDQAILLSAEALQATLLHCDETIALYNITNSRDTLVYGN